MSKRPLAIHLDRLEQALGRHEVKLKRHQLLDIASHAFGFRNSNAFAAADLSAAQAEPVGRVTLGVENVILARDSISGAIFAVDETFLEQVSAEEDHETYLPTPYGHLADVSRLLDEQLPQIQAKVLQPQDYHVIGSMVFGELLFWEENQGWSDLKSATKYPDQTGRLPSLHENEAEWMTIKEASDRAKYEDLKVEVGPEIVEQAQAIAAKIPAIMATFNPQAWINNYATGVDLDDRENTYDVTVDVIAKALFENNDTIEDYLNGLFDKDEFQHATHAPAWVQEWDGPFDIEIECDIDTMDIALIGLDADGAYAFEPDDGHDHDLVDADGVDTGTDAEPKICRLCGLLTAESNS